jgi:CBS domain-containing protein
LDNVKAVARTQWAALTAGEIMTPVSTLPLADADDDLWSLIERMNSDGVSEVPVVENGNLLGLITRDGLLNHLRLRSEFAA